MSEPRIPLTSASEVFDLMASDDSVLHILSKAGVADSVRINVAYALIAQRKDAALSAPVTGEGSSALPPASPSSVPRDTSANLPANRREP